jgi:hypothetical protein
MMVLISVERLTVIRASFEINPSNKLKIKSENIKVAIFLLLSKCF